MDTPDRPLASPAAPPRAVQVDPSRTNLATALVAAQRVLKCLAGLLSRVKGMPSQRGRANFARAVGELSYRRTELRAVLTPCAWELAGIQGPQGITCGTIRAPSAHALVADFADEADTMSEWVLGEELHAAARKWYGFVSQRVPTEEHERGLAVTVGAARCEKEILNLAARPIDGSEVFLTELQGLLGGLEDLRRLWVALDCEYAIAKRRREDRGEVISADDLPVPYSPDSLYATSSETAVLLALLGARERGKQNPDGVLKVDSIIAEARKIAEARGIQKGSGRSTVHRGIIVAQKRGLLDPDERRLTSEGRSWLEERGEQEAA